MSFGDYEAGRLARAEAAAPLAGAIAKALPGVTPDDAAKAARWILDQRVVYTANAYDARVAETRAIRDGLKTFKGLLDEC